VATAAGPPATPDAGCRSNTGMPGSHRSSSIRRRVYDRAPNQPVRRASTWDRALQPLVGRVGRDRCGLAGPPRGEALAETGVRDREDRRREQPRVLAVADADRGDRHALWHLDDGEERVETVRD